MTRPTTVIETPEALTHAIDSWRVEPALGVDTESNSFFVYREKTCLVQLSTRDADWILDPLAVDLRPLGPLMADPAIEKIFHASEYDVTSLKRDYGFTFRNLFDTLVAAKAIGRRKLGLGNLVEEVLGVKLTKDEQRSDWGRRPLSADQITYAFADTRYLLPLSDALKLEVQALGPEIIEEVAIDCIRMTEKEGRPREVDPEAFERHKSARKMDPVSRQILRTLYEARETRARETDKPPFRVVSDESLGEIAVRKPATREELQKIPGVTPSVMGRHGPLLLEAVRAGLAAGALPFKRRTAAAIDPLEDERYEALRTWRRTVAEARAVEVDVIVGNAALRVLAKAYPKTVEALVETGALDPYRVRKYGEAMLGALNVKPAQGGLFGRTP